MKFFTLIILINLFIYIHSNISDLSCSDESVKVYSIKDCYNRKLSDSSFTHCCFQDYINPAGIRHKYCVEVNDDYYERLAKNIEELETQLEVKIITFDCTSFHIKLNIMLFLLLIINISI